MNTDSGNCINTLNVRATRHSSTNIRIVDLYNLSFRFLFKSVLYGRASTVHGKTSGVSYIKTRKKLIIIIIIIIIIIMSAKGFLCVVQANNVFTIILNLDLFEQLKMLA
jgi:hypothetical protein